MMRRIACVLPLFLLFASTAVAQQGTADLRGKVVDQQGAVLPGVTVVVRHQESGLFRETATGTDGTFLMSAMSPGIYSVSAELQGFKKVEQRDIRLAVGATAQVELKLEVGGLTESVTVTAESPLVDTTTQEIGGRISAQEFVDTPSFNRNFAGYLGMLPGVVASISATTFGADSISVAGQDVRNVTYTMDGSNNNDTFNGGNGGAQTRVPVEAVQEFQLLTSQFDAEFGLASGGIVNSVSKQGTNQYHGALFAFYQDEKLSTNEYFAKREGLEKADSKQQQFGGVVGGPIIRDKAHYFASVERVLLDSAVTTNIPTRPDLNRTDFETTKVWNLFFRGDHQVNANNTWGLRYAREDSPQPLQIQDVNHTPSRHEAETDVDWSFVGNLSSVIGATKVNTFRVSAVSEDVFFGNPNFNTNGHDQKILAPLLDYLNFEDQQSPRANRRLDVAYGADNVFAWFLPNKGGDHDMKFGVNYLYSTLRVQDYGNMNGTWTFNTDRPYNAADAFTYPERFSVRVGAPVNFLMKGHFIGLFAQDKWRIGNDFTLSLGARYDFEVLPTPNQENPLFADNPDGYPEDNNNISPRLGFSYAMEGGRAALRGGAGIFYQRTSYTFLTGMFSGGRFSDSFTVNYPTNNADTAPRQGRLPSEPILLTCCTVNHAAIDATYPPGSRVRNGGTVRFDNPDRQNAYARQYSIGYERQFGTNLGLSVDFIRSEQRNQYVLKELNPPVRNSTVVAGSTNTRTNPLVGSVGEWAASVVTLVNEGYIDYNSLQVSGTKRSSRGWAGRLSYAFSRGRGNTATGQGAASNAQFLGDLNLDQEIGPTAVDRPHILTVSGSYDVPRTGGLKVSAVYTARSGTPFSLIDSSVDHDRNGITANEYLPAGPYSYTTPDTSYEFEYKGGRNGGRGPNFQRLDLRMGYRVRVGNGRTLDAFLDLFNATNQPNFNNPGTDQRITADFLRILSTRDESPPRTAQLNFRFGF
jgi:Carboxypeptidase regulatory-like domain